MIHVVSVALVIVDLAKVDAMFLVCEFVTPFLSDSCRAKVK